MASTHGAMQGMSSRFYLEEDTGARLTVPVRLNVFATVERIVGKGKRQRTVAQGVAWQGWNADARMETQMSRLQGAGSFYWQGAIQAWHAAKRIMESDPRVHQIGLETISGRGIGRMYR